MRVVGVLFLLAAIGIGALWPWAQVNFFGKEVAKLDFGNLRGPVSASADFTVREEDNPIRIRFRAAYKIDGKLPPIKIPVKVLITDADGTLLSGVISFPTKGIETGPELPKTRGSTPLNFDVINPGVHTIALSLAPNPNDGGIKRPDIERISAKVIANAPPVTDDHKALAAVLALTGLYLLTRSRRKKRIGGSTPPPQNWGRG